jgi:hypothetical protein
MPYFYLFPHLCSVHPFLPSSAGDNVFSKYFRDLGCRFPHSIWLGMDGSAILHLGDLPPNHHPIRPLLAMSIFSHVEFWLSPFLA